MAISARTKALAPRVIVCVRLSMTVNDPSSVAGSFGRENTVREVFSRGREKRKGFMGAKDSQRWPRTPKSTNGLVGKPGQTILRAMNHVGIGYDVHAFVTGRKLILGGVEIPHSKGLDGHSDADVLMHAICDAVLGALGKGDIGTFFPNTDPRWRGAPSKIFLEEAARQIQFENAKLINVDAT